jgi:hypothetical protein
MWYESLTLVDHIGLGLALAGLMFVVVHATLFRRR